jgi:hypothetical protein
MLMSATYCPSAGVPGGERGGAAAAGDGRSQTLPKEAAAARAADDPTRADIRHPGPQFSGPTLLSPRRP